MVPDFPTNANRINGPFSSLAGIATLRSKASVATRSKDQQQLSTHDVDSLSMLDGTHEQVQTVEREMDMEDGYNSDTKHSLSKAAAMRDGVEEIASLRAEIQRLQSDSEAEQGALDDMLSELTTAQEELGEVKTLLAAKESECMDLQVRLAHAGVGDTTLSGAVAQPAPHEIFGSAVMDEKRSVEMEQKISDLMASLQTKDGQLRAKDAELADERAARMELLQKYQSALVLEQATAAQVKAQEAVAQSQDAAEADKQRRKISELRQHVRFFKANSEQLAQEIREIKDQNLHLGENLDVRQRELDDERSMNLVLKMQVGSA